MTSRRRQNAVRRGPQTGAFLLETALILPLFVFLLISGLELGRVLWVRNVLTDACAEGARLAILHEPSNEDVRLAVENTLSRQGITLPHETTISSRTPDAPVAVRIEATLDLVVLPNFLSAAAGLESLAAQSVMRHEP